MIELIFKFVIDNRLNFLELLQTSKIILSSEDFCQALTRTSVEDVPKLVSNQEEADTRVILHSAQVLQPKTDLYVNLHSPSADTDILVLAVALLDEFKDRITIDSGTGMNRKLIRLGNINMPDNY